MLVTGRLPDVDSSKILPVVERIDQIPDVVEQCIYLERAGTR